MISENDLRIGNWLEIEGVIRQVTAQTIVAVTQSNLAGRHDFCNPIPLSPDILEKAGFVQNFYSTEGTQFNEPFYKIELEAKGWLLDFDHTFGWFVSPKTSRYNVIPIKYLHQLQNLYYCLTGTELIINL